MPRTKLSFAAEKLRLFKAEEGRCAKCGFPLTEFNPSGGSYAYKTTTGAWVTGEQCQNCASQQKTGARDATTACDYYNEKRQRAITRTAKRKRRGPYGTGGNDAFTDLLEELKKPTPQRFGKEKSWKKHWATDLELRRLFQSYKGMRSFASSYGYGVGDVREMKKHKEKLGEGRRR